MEETSLLYIIKIVIIGLVQGFTEPIPVSSSGHVIIASELLGVGEQGFTFAILTNTASLCAILFIYRKDLQRLIIHSIQYMKTRNGRYKIDLRFVIYIVIGIIPAGVLGVLLSGNIGEDVIMTRIALMLFITGNGLRLNRKMKGKEND